MTYIEILVKLRKVIRSINLESKKIEKSFGISIPQLLCLQYLSEQEDYKALAAHIKDYLNLNASTISGIISRLENKGLVAKLPKLGDKRAAYVILTAKGLELLRATPTTLQEKLTNRLVELSPQQINSLYENIDLLVKLMDAENIDASPVVTINVNN